MVFACTKYCVLAYCFYIVAFFLSCLSALSANFTPALYDYVAEIEFNEFYFSGSVNSLPVHNLSILRLGNWAGCYFDAYYSGECVPAAYPYELSYVNSTDNSVHTVTPKGMTAGLLFHALGVIATFLALCHPFFSTYAVEKSAAILLVCATGFDFLLYFSVHFGMQSIGASVVTTFGTDFMVNGGCVACLLFGALVKHHGKGKDGKGDDGGGGGDGGTMYITGKFLDDYIAAI